MTNAHPEHTVEIDVAGPEPDRLESSLEVESSPEKRSARLAMYAGVALTAVGSIILYLGYNGAATHPIVAEQMPYVISGGFVGASMIMLGAVMIIAHIILRMQASLRTDVQELRDSLQDLSDSLSQAPLGSGGGSTNGFVVAVRGGSSFHRPDCRLVAKRTGFKRYAAADAGRQGLSPCRVCNP